jgi:uncharacterized protein (TIGR00290 family)
MEKAVLAWSGGKDSAMALFNARRAGEFEIVSLLTTITKDYDRVSMHGVRRELLEEQARATGLPLSIVSFPAGSDNSEYERLMKEALAGFGGAGVTSVIFGDIFLEELRAYREQNLAKAGMKGVFPLWKRDTAELAREFIGLGFSAVVTCVDTQSLDGNFAGRVYDAGFLAELPRGVDPCGENGEFHSFVFRGPVFNRDIEFRKGEVVLRDNRFNFCDLLPMFSFHAETQRRRDHRAGKDEL